MVTKKIPSNIFARNFFRKFLAIFCFLALTCVAIHAKTSLILSQTDPFPPRTPDETPPFPCLYPVTTNQVKLIQLARAYSPAGLSYAEEQMLLGAASNQRAICTSSTSYNIAMAMVFESAIKKIPPGAGNSFFAISNSDNWAGDTIIRGDLIKWLCSDPSASSLVGYEGIGLNGARIDGNLDLHDLKIPFPIRIDYSAFSDDIELYGCEIKVLDLLGTHVKNFKGNRLRVDGSLNLANGFEADGQVNLLNAKIGGDVSCVGSIFTSTNGFSILADGITVGGSLMLTDGFKANGEVRFVDAEIRSIVNFDGGSFVNDSGVAIDFTGAKIGGEFSLRGGLIDGKVGFQNSSVNEWISFKDTKFQGSHLGGIIFDGRAAQVGGNVILDCNYYALGEVDFTGAKIGLDLFVPYGASLNFSTVGGNLSIGNSVETNSVKNQPVVGNCSICNATILNAVILNRANIAGEINLNGSTMSRLFIKNDEWQDQSALDISSTKMHILQDQLDDWPKPGRLLLNNCSYDSFDLSSLSDSDSRLKWLQLQPTNVFLPQPYEQLASVFRTMGLEDDAKAVLIAKNIEHSKYTKRFTSSWWWYNVFGKYVISYGYESIHALIYSLVFIGLGSFVAFVSKRSGKIVYTGDKPPHSGGKQTGKEFQSLVYSFETFVPLLNLDMAQHWRPVGKLRWYFWLHRLFGWVLATLWLGALSGLVKS